MAAYRVEVSPAIRKTLRKLPPDAQAAILDMLHNLQAMPRPPGG